MLTDANAAIELAAAAYASPPTDRALLLKYALRTVNHNGIHLDLSLLRHFRRVA